MSQDNSGLVDIKLPKYSCKCDMCNNELKFEEKDITRIGKLPYVDCNCGHKIRLNSRYVMPELNSPELHWLFGYLRRDSMIEHITSCSKALNVDVHSMYESEAVSIVFNYLMLCAGDWRTVKGILDDLRSADLVMRDPRSNPDESCWIMFDLCLTSVPREIAYTNQQAQTVVRDKTKLEELTGIPARLFKSVTDKESVADSIPDNDVLAEKILEHFPQKLLAFNTDSKIKTALLLSCDSLGLHVSGDLRDKADAILSLMPNAYYADADVTTAALTCVYNLLSSNES